MKIIRFNGTIVGVLHVCPDGWEAEHTIAGLRRCLRGQ